MSYRDDAIKHEMDARRAQDLRDLTLLVLQSPVKPGGDLHIADGEISAEELSKLNTDVQTRIMLRMANKAFNGDVKAAEMIFKYAGLEPASRQEITLDVPQLMDDMSCRATPTPPSPLAKPMIDEPDEDEGVIVVSEVAHE